MPSPRTWLGRAEEILAVLQAMHSPSLDRPAIEELFQLQRRAAITMMNQVGAWSVTKSTDGHRVSKGSLVSDQVDGGHGSLVLTKSRGGSSLVDRRKLIHWVENVVSMEGAAIERRKTVAQEISRSMAEVQAVRDELRARGRPPVSFALVDQVLRSTVTSLPSSIHIEPGRITVDFPAADPVRAVELLYALALAVANDTEEFRRLAGVEESNQSCSIATLLANLEDHKQSSIDPTRQG